MKITVRNTIVSGNLGDGFKNNNRAAELLGEYEERKLVGYFDKHYPEYDVEVETRILRDSFGAGGGISVWSDDDLNTPEIEQELDYYLDQWWSDWLDTDEAQGA